MIKQNDADGFPVREEFSSKFGSAVMAPHYFPYYVYQSRLWGDRTYTFLVNASNSNYFNALKPISPLKTLLLSTAALLVAGVPIGLGVMGGASIAATVTRFQLFRNSKTVFNLPVLPRPTVDIPPLYIYQSPQLLLDALRRLVGTRTPSNDDSKSEQSNTHSHARPPPPRPPSDFDAFIKRQAKQRQANQSQRAQTLSKPSTPVPPIAPAKRRYDSKGYFALMGLSSNANPTQAVSKVFPFDFES